MKKVNNQEKQSEELFFLLKNLSNQMNLCFEKRTECSLTRYEIMHILAKKERVLQGDLQRALKIDPAAVTRHLKKLEEEKCIVRERNSQNNREVYVQITPIGLTRMQACQSKTVHTLEQVYQGITNEQRKELIGIVEKISQNISTIN